MLEGVVVLAGKSYEDLIVWQKAMDLVVETYGLVKLLPKTEQYALSDQMRRAAVSIPSNIAEGQQRNSEKEFVRFLYIAKGSEAELKTQILICQRLNYLDPVQTKDVIDLCDEIGKILSSLIRKLTTNN